jgi:DNA repair protein SbcC/Rad50
LKIRDAASGRDILTKRKDAEDWLNEQLGIDFGKYGRDLFQNAIGVAQGMMTGAFAVSPGARKKIFDPILRVDEYDQAFKRLVDTKNYLDNLLHEAQREQSHISGYLEQLPPTRKRFEDLIEQISVGERNFELAQEQIDSRREEMSFLDEIFRKLGELDGEISLTNITLTNLESQIETVEASLEEARLANDVVVMMRTGHERYEQAKKELAELEVRQLIRNRLLEEVQAVDLEISRLDQQISGLHRDLAEVEAAEKKIVELEPDVDKQTECEIRRNTSLDQLKERDRTIRELEELKTRVQEKKKSIEVLDIQLIQRKDLRIELSEKSKERDDVISGLRDISDKISQAQVMRETLTQQLQEALLKKQSWETICKQRDDLTVEIEKDKQNLDRLKQQVDERVRLEEGTGGQMIKKKRNTLLG